MVAITFVTLWGLIFPLISELFAGETVTVGAPYYNSVNGPVILALLFVMGIGPNLSWRNTSKENLTTNLLVPLSLLLISFILLASFSSRPLISSLSISVIILVASTILIEWAKGSYRITKAGTPWFMALIKLIMNNRKKYGGYVVHISILLVAIGVIGINFYQINSNYSIFQFHN